MRPSLSPAAPPGDGRRLFSHLLSVARSRYPMIESGEFGAHMQVSPTNDDPVTFMLQVKNSQLKSDQAKSD
jgi:D-tyrosyl-tRNA(Tyr) deacylase